MKAPQNKHALKRSIRFSIIILIILISTFFTSIVVGKSNGEDTEKVKPDVTVTEPNPTQQHDEHDGDKNTEEAEEKNEVQTEEKPNAEKKPTGKVVYLTFDDGPSKFTNEFLNILQEQDVKATFFMQGSNLHKVPLQESVKRAATEGHYIGAHSMTHDYKTLYNGNQFVPEMKETINLISDITGTTPNLVRAPYGSAPGLNGEQIRDQIADAGIKIWDWTIDSNDWALTNNPMQIVENIKKGTMRDKEIVLMHEKLQTLTVLPEIIAFYKEQGYEFVVYEEDDHFSLNFLNDVRL